METLSPTFTEAGPAVPGTAGSDLGSESFTGGLLRGSLTVFLGLFTGGSAGAAGAVGVFSGGLMMILLLGAGGVAGPGGFVLSTVGGGVVLSAGAAGLGGIALPSLPVAGDGDLPSAGAGPAGFTGSDGLAGAGLPPGISDLGGSATSGILSAGTAGLLASGAGGAFAGSGGVAGFTGSGTGGAVAGSGGLMSGGNLVAGPVLPIFFGVPGGSLEAGPPFSQDRNPSRVPNNANTPVVPLSHLSFSD